MIILLWPLRAVPGGVFLIRAEIRFSYRTPPPVTVLKRASLVSSPRARSQEERERLGR